MLRQIITFAITAFAVQAAHAAEAGKVIFVAGGTQIAGKPAVLGTPVSEGELISTAADGYVYIKTTDNGLFIIRPSSKARIASYHIDRANPANTRIKLELLSGVARSQSGDAVKLARQNFRFNTPVAAIGVRGTDFTVFTTNDTSRVAVFSGGITVSGFAGACRPEGIGPCEGGSSRELFAAQAGKMLQVQRGSAAPELMQGGALAPDAVAPPLSDEPLTSTSADGKSAALMPSLDPKKAVALPLPGLPAPGTQPPIVLPEVPPGGPQPVEPPLPAREVTWGRWASVLGAAPTAALSKEGAERIAMNEYYVLYKSKNEAPYSVPERGSIGFALAGGEAIVTDRAAGSKSAATLENGKLVFDFDQRTYATSLDMLNRGQRYSLASTGKVAANGQFDGAAAYSPSNNMTVNGILGADDTASYLFQGRLDEARTYSGVALWNKK